LPGGGLILRRREWPHGEEAMPAKYLRFNNRLARENQTMIIKNRQSVLDQVFTPDEQLKMQAEDGEAWGAVTGILFVVVTGGTILGIIGVLLSL
jgi:hypothetical protein